MSKSPFSKITSKGKDKNISQIDQLIKKIQEYTSKVDTHQILKAYECSKEAHQGQKRQSGEPYIIHPLAVASILVDLHMDQETVITALLHDVVEDTKISLDQIQKDFGEKVAFLVDGVTKISKIDFRNTHERQSENIRKMIMAMGKDVRVLLIKLADRLHNLRTLQHVPSSKQSRIAKETLEIYTPLASRLGMNQIKSEMEDLSFQYSRPETFSVLSEKMSKINKDREKYIQEVLVTLEDALDRHKIKKYEVKGRYKNIYSIHRKMSQDNLSFEDIYDLVAFRVCVEKIHECYEVLGLVHALWRPVPGRFKDFIAMPKSNNYQSLHTTVVGPKGQKIEMQIRTHEMHLMSERGIAAHWIYKSNDEKPAKKTVNTFNWLQEFVSFHQNSSDPTDFLESIKLDLFESAIYVFTPAGDIKEFPKGATPIDFAYSIHTDIGSKIIGAKVNGFQVPLKYKLKSGDTIEVITSRKQQPSKDWLKICVTSRARSKIKNHLNLEEQKISIEIGRKMMEKQLQKWSVPEISSHKRYDELLKYYGFSRMEDAYIKMAVGKLSFEMIYKFLYQKSLGHTEEETLSKFKLPFLTNKKKQKTNTSPIIIEGTSNILVNFAKCCNPILGDSVKAYITAKKGIVIHRSLCWQLSSVAPERFVEVDWADNNSQNEFTLDLQVVCHDKTGILSKLGEVFNSFDLNIIDVDIVREADFKVFLVFKTRVKNTEQLQKLIDRLHKVDSVMSVSRKINMDLN